MVDLICPETVNPGWGPPPITNILSSKDVTPNPCLAISTNKPPFSRIHESCLSGGQSHGINYVTNTFDFIGGTTAKSQLRDLWAIIIQG
ncbi:MAG: hypothetical protein WA461_01455 [Nitrososphaeraceae archaeon]